MDKKALITGINGQAGSYLAEELLQHGYEVHGIIRRSANPNLVNLANCLNKIHIHEADITDIFSLSPIFKNSGFTHVFNAAAQSHVYTSFSQPTYTMQVTGLGVLNVLECVKQYCPEARFLQFSSSEMFGDQYDINKRYNNNGVYSGHYGKFDLIKYQDEITRMNPQSPYAVAKLAGYNYTKLYREAYGLFASNVIMFNYESPRRGDKFVTKKITNYIKHIPHQTKFRSQLKKSQPNAKISFGIEVCGIPPRLKLGNLDAKRDWGYCPDYMEGCRMILEHTKPDDFVLATGETHTVKEFAEEAFDIFGLKAEHYIEIDETLKRPSEVPYLCGNATKAKSILGWEPKVKFKKLVEIMVNG